MSSCLFISKPFKAKVTFKEEPELHYIPSERLPRDPGDRLARRHMELCAQNHERIMAHVKACYEGLALMWHSRSGETVQ